MKTLDSVPVVLLSVIGFLGVCLATSAYVGTGTLFFLELISFTIVLLILVIFFRRTIERIVASLIADLNRINDESNTEETSTQHGRQAKLGAVLIGIGVAFGAYACFLSLSDTQAYYSLISEDGLVENVSSLMWFLAAAGTLLTLGVRWKRARNRVAKRTILAYLVLVLFFIVCGGEEIAWGQRALNFDTPDVIRAVNVQNETTIHNIGSISVFSNVFFLLNVVFFLLLPFLAAKYVVLRSYLRYYCLPTPCRLVTCVFLVSLSVWVFIGIRFGTLGFHPFSFLPEKYYTQMDDEIFELFAAYSFLSFAVMDFALACAISPRTGAGGTPAPVSPLKADN